MFVNENFDNYKYLVRCSDNYIVLSSDGSVYGESGDPDTVNVIYQYLNPSILTIETTESLEYTRHFDDVSSEVSSNFFDRADAPIIFVCQFLVCVWFVWLLNQLSKLAHKGGVFGG